MNRRRFVELSSAYVALPLIGNSTQPRTISKPIPSTGETLPVIGMGTWLTFDVGRASDARAQRRNVLQRFFDDGGRLVDSSPMYGSSEPVLGALLPQIRQRQNLFAASKVWIYGKRLGAIQIEESRKQWGIPKFDLIEVHNLLDWEGHLDTLREMKSNGNLRYIGITTSHGRRHDEAEKIMRSEKLDFIQFTYNMNDRSAESRLLPIARERGIAVITNRPLDGGALFDKVRGKPLPSFASEIDVHNWAQYFLKFVVSHPAVNVAIPATSQAAHMAENMGSMVGRLPEIAMRRQMAAYFDRL